MSDREPAAPENPSPLSPPQSPTVPLQAEPTLAQVLRAVERSTQASADSKKSVDRVYDLVLDLKPRVEKLESMVSGTPPPPVSIPPQTVQKLEDAAGLVLGLKTSDQKAWVGRIIVAIAFAVGLLHQFGLLHQ